METRTLDLYDVFEELFHVFFRQEKEDKTFSTELKSIYLDYLSYYNEQFSHSVDCIPDQSKEIYSIRIDSELEDIEYKAYSFTLKFINHNFYLDLDIDNNKIFVLGVSKFKLLYFDYNLESEVISFLYNFLKACSEFVCWTFNKRSIRTKYMISDSSFDPLKEFGSTLVTDSVLNFEKEGSLTLSNNDNHEYSKFTFINTFTHVSKINEFKSFFASSCIALPLIKESTNPDLIEDLKHVIKRDYSSYYNSEAQETLKALLNNILNLISSPCSLFTKYSNSFIDSKSYYEIIFIKLVKNGNITIYYQSLCIDVHHQFSLCFSEDYKENSKIKYLFLTAISNVLFSNENIQKNLQILDDTIFIKVNFTESLKSDTLDDIKLFNFILSNTKDIISTKEKEFLINLISV